MKLWLVLASLFTIGVLAGAQSDGSGVIHVDPAKVAAAIRCSSRAQVVFAESNATFTRAAFECR